MEVYRYLTVVVSPNLSRILGVETGERESRVILFDRDGGGLTASNLLQRTFDHDVLFLLGDGGWKLVAAFESDNKQRFYFMKAEQR